VVVALLLTCCAALPRSPFRRRCRLPPRSTTAVGPGLLRMGGSPEDSLVYDADGTCVPGSGGKGPGAPTGYYCSQVTPYVYDCLTPARWEALLAYVAGTGMKLVLGLNGAYTHDPAGVCKEGGG
jgi:hypothetical protein